MEGEVEQRKSGTGGEREPGGHEGHRAEGQDETADERTRRERLTDAFNAFRESLEEAISGARDRGDAAEGKARELLRAATERARSATEEAREKFDFVTHERFEELAARVARLERRMAERPGGSGDLGEEDRPTD